MGKQKTEVRGVIPLFRSMRPAPLLALAKKHEAGEKLTQGELSGERWTATEVKEAFEAGKTPALYQPALVAMAAALGYEFAIIGQEKAHAKAPKDWPDKIGEWKPGRYITAFRTCHEPDLRRNVTKPEENLVESGQYCVVLGDSDRPAVMNLNGSVGDNSYAHAALAGKSLALKGMGDQLADLFIRINTKARIIKMDGDGCGGAEVVVLAYQEGSPGYIERDGKRLNKAQVQKAFKADDDGKLLDADAVKGLKWVPLDTPIIGTPYSPSQLVQRVKMTLDANRTIREGEKRTGWGRFENRNSRRSEEKANRQSPEEGVVTNMRTMTRSAMQGLFAFGARHALTGSGTFFNCWGNAKDDPRFNVVIGVRCGDELTAADRQRVAANKPAKPAKEPKAPKAPKAPKVAKPKVAKAPKAKVAKATKAPKVKAPKAPKVKAPKAPAIVGEPAAPVSDTSDAPTDAVPNVEPATVSEPTATTGS